MYRIGVDIGETSIKIGLIDQEPKIVDQSSIPFLHVNAAEVATQIAEAITALITEHGLSVQDVTGIGVVIPGSIDFKGEVVLDAHSLDFHHVPFKALLQEHFADVPVFLANDAYGVTLAELRCGALRGCKTAALLMLGTGVGGGVVLNGKLFSGGRGRGIELGHIPLVSGGELCTCGVRGCVEAYCSATALIKEAVRAIKDNPESMLSIKCGGDLSLVDAKLVIDSAKEGDPSAKAVFDKYTEYLVTACLSVVHLLDPEVIAIGGSVSHAGEFLFEPLRTKVWEKNFFKSHEVIVPAALGDDAGMIGASLLGQE